MSKRDQEHPFLPFAVDVFETRNRPHGRVEVYGDYRGRINQILLDLDDLPDCRMIFPLWEYNQCIRPLTGSTHVECSDPIDLDGIEIQIDQYALSKEGALCQN